MTVRIRLHAAAAAALAIFAIFAAATPSEARDYPVCSRGANRFTGEGDSIRCEYDNFAQCRAAVLGLTGTCITNPLLGDLPPDQPRRKRRHS
jgi:hypothetical protein